MRVLLTGAYGTVGTAIIDHLGDDGAYEWTYLNRSDRPPNHEYGGYDTVVADVADAGAIRPAFEGQDAVVHLAACPGTGCSWEEVLSDNLVGQYNTLEAAREEEVGTFVFASTNHVMGEYENEHAPDLYEPGYGLVLDHTDPVRPDSLYGVSKAFGEELGRYYVENYDYPRQFYSLRICSVRSAAWDHPYGDAERGVESGDTERGSEKYAEQVARMKAMWQSRRDCAHQVECCLRDDGVTFGVFSGVSDNVTRWYDIEHARSHIGYRPRDDGCAWEAPP